MISYKDYLKALPALSYSENFLKLVDARIDVYFAENPSLLPANVVLSDKPDGYQINIIERFETLVDGDKFSFMLIQNEGSGLVEVSVPLSLIVNAGYNHYLAVNDDADVALTFRDEAMERVEEYLDKNPTMLLEGIKISDDLFDGYYLNFKKVGKIRPNNENEVVFVVKHFDDTSIHHTFGIPFEVVAGTKA